jgi:hypothetical protein
MRVISCPCRVSAGNFFAGGGRLPPFPAGTIVFFAEKKGKKV